MRTRAGFACLLKEKSASPEVPAAAPRQAPLEKISYDIRIVDSRAICFNKQTYINDTKFAQNIEFVFPLLVNSCLLEFHALVGDKVYQGLVGERDAVAKRVEKLKEKGVNFAAAKHMEGSKDLVHLEIGLLQPGETLHVQLKFSLPLDVLSKSFFRLLIPVVILPRVELKDENLSNSGLMAAAKDRTPTKAAPGNEGIQIGLQATYSLEFRIEVMKKRGDDYIQMKLSSLDDDQVEIMQDDKSFLLKIKENKTVIPNVDLEFLFQRTASQSMVPTISKGGYRDEIPANVFQQTKLEVQHFPIVGHRQFMLPIKGTFLPDFRYRSEDEEGVFLFTC